MSIEIKMLLITRKLPNKTNNGLNNIINKLVRNLSEGLIVPLYIIFKKSLIKGAFPDAMKIADVILLYKSKERYL